MRKATVGLALLAILAVLLSGCGGGGGGGGGTPAPEGCPSNPAENGPDCPNFEPASQLYIEICASKGGNVTYARDESTCCLQEIKCIGEGGYVFPVSIGASTECIDDSDCKISGCSSQHCVPLYDDLVGTCHWLPEYECLSLTSCGCGDGICAWAETPEYTECMSRATGSMCPDFIPLSSEAVSACQASGGAQVAFQDAQGCFANASCSTEIACGLFTYNCPEGFACSATLDSPEGACKKGQDFCAGAGNVSCPKGSRCEILGNYQNAGGVCRRLCDESSVCANGTECVNEMCMPAQNRACDSSRPCPPQFACEGGICTLAEGRFCNSTTIPCPTGHLCDMRAGTGATGSCKPLCGGADGIKCREGEACILPTTCKAGETCMGYEGMCVPNNIPDSLAVFCGKQLGQPTENVSEFQKCRNSSLFIMARAGGAEYAYVHSDGRIERECGKSGLASDPTCAALKAECGKPYDAVNCAQLTKERFMLCAPPFSASASCPAREEPVCARLMVGMNPVLRSPEWRTFRNGCEACNANNPGQIAMGYWRGAC